MELSEVSRLYAAVEDETRRAFIGQEEVLGSVLVALFARGHVLLEGVPGVGKTLLVRVLGQVLGCHFRRVQFTPDLMPSDVTGSTLYNAQKGAFEFKHGPVFTHILLADEVNRAPAKTQSSMLEAMAERSVTVDGVTHPLPSPFFVLATQNPLESAGTYALPEAQLDRFLFKVLIDHPSVDVEAQLLRNVRDGFDAADLEAMQLRQVTSPELVLDMQRSIQGVQVDDKIIGYIAQLVANTRRHRAVQVGASPRAAIALLHTARVQAAVEGRTFVVPDDVKRHGRAVLRHRLILQPDAEIEGVTTDEVVEGVLQETQVPGMGEAAGDRRGAAPRGGGAAGGAGRGGGAFGAPRGGAPLGGALARDGGGPIVGEQGLSTEPVRERRTALAPGAGPGGAGGAFGVRGRASAFSTTPWPPGRPTDAPGPPAEASDGLPSLPALTPAPRRAAAGEPAAQVLPARPATGAPASAARSSPSQVPEDVTLLDARPPPPTGPAVPAGLPLGVAPSRPAGLDPDTIPPAFGRPLGRRSGGEGGSST